MDRLLDPKNDYVFKRLFASDPELLVALINDLCPDLPDITAVDVINPGISDADLQAKAIVLDVLARDVSGHHYNIEMQVRRYPAWGQRSAFYLARLLSQQLGAGENYSTLKAVVGIHLLDFDLFDASEPERQQACWRFELRDATQPQVTLGNVLQLNLIELKKADRLDLDTGPLRDWITFFEHWQETALMANITHPPVQRAMAQLQALSADDEARYRALARERALHDEATLLKDAEERGERRGEKRGERRGREDTARNLLRLGLLDNVQIAQATGLSEEHVQALRADAEH